MEQAKARAQTDREKQRVALFERATWDYLVAGRRHHIAHQTAPIPAVKAPRVAAADGDVARVDWDTAAELGGSWYDRGQDTPAARRLAGRLAHDGQFLYLELTDPCDTGKLTASATVFAYDDWEIFVAKQRAQPYRQYAVGPGGLTVALSHGEVNGQGNVPVEDCGMKAVSDVSAPDRWVTRLAFPLARLVPGGVKPGETFYLNVIRVSGPALSGQGGLGIDTWVSFCSVHDVDRLAEVTLE
jgi:hypothetical protein